MQGERTLTQLSIVIPSYRFEKTIEKFFYDCLAEFPQAEFIIVNDEGSDNKFWKTVSDKIKYAIVPHVGKGFAVNKGFSMASGDFVGFIDDDGSVSPGEFKRMFNFLKNSSYDGVIASRKTAGSDIAVKQPLFRRILGIAFINIVKMFFKLEYEDTQCGAKIFRKDVIKKITPLKSTGFSFDLEILIKCKKYSFNIKEFGVKWIDDKKSTLGAKRILKMVYEVIMLKNMH